MASGISGGLREVGIPFIEPISTPFSEPVRKCLIALTTSFGSFVPNRTSEEDPRFGVQRINTVFHNSQSSSSCCLWGALCARGPVPVTMPLLSPEPPYHLGGLGFRVMARNHTSYIYVTGARMENWHLSLNLIEAFREGIPNLFPVRTSPRIWAALGHRMLSPH